MLIRIVLAVGVVREAKYDSMIATDWETDIYAVVLATTTANENGDRNRRASSSSSITESATVLWTPKSIRLILRHDAWPTSWNTIPGQPNNCCILTKRYCLEPMYLTLEEFEMYNQFNTRVDTVDTVDRIANFKV